MLRELSKERAKMPFVSKVQLKDAFSGGLGPEMQEKAKTWADETPDIKHLPVRLKKPKSKPKS